LRNNAMMNKSCQSTKTNDFIAAPENFQDCQVFMCKDVEAKHAKNISRSSN
jgi:hypothetical protein